MINSELNAGFMADDDCTLQDRIKNISLMRRDEVEEREILADDSI